MSNPAPRRKKVVIVTAQASDFADHETWVKSIIFAFRGIPDGDAQNLAPEITVVETSDELFKHSDCDLVMFVSTTQSSLALEYKRRHPHHPLVCQIDRSPDRIYYIPKSLVVNPHLLLEVLA